jgi:hypothetical protein
MVTGRSILHVNQGPGKHYSTLEIKGYYNDLTEKISKDKERDEKYIPKQKTGKNIEFEFSIEIFQYGLAAYDLFLETGEKKYLNKFLIMVEWAHDKQKNNGAWDTFVERHPKHPYSAMAQGEGISLLVRAYVHTKEDKYQSAAKKAYDFMLIPIEEGGTTLYDNDLVFLKEYTHLPTVLNGWIFALFGIYDYYLITNDEEVHKFFELNARSIAYCLPQYDNGYWSKYDIDHKIASPFYHNLHISQLRVLNELTNNETFSEYADKWEKYASKRRNRRKAFWQKARQKLSE